jgi:hypothetical protein
VQQATGTTIRAQLTSTTVAATMLARPGEDATYRWLMGEDVTGQLQGALRDMWNPTCYGNAGKVSDPHYHCDATDGGGVHFNSGIPNHAFALLVDGGSYNGHAISPIGMTKAAQLYFRAQSVYQVPDSDFADHADALEASCQDLLGQEFGALGDDPLNGAISEADCAQVATAIAAVELRTPPTFCNFPPLLNPGNAATCHPVMTDGVTLPIASFDFETSPSDWTVSHATASPTFTPRDWTWVNALPSGKAGSGWFGPTPNIGSCQAQNEAGVLHLTSPEIMLPTTSVFARATFEHWFGLEPGWDGGNLRVSVNGGAWQLLPPSELTFNNYIAFLFSAAQGNTNPLAGQPAWTSTRAGSVTDGSWGRTHVNLGNFAQPGDTIRLRWDLGTDGCAGRAGWYLDNVNVFSCTPNVPQVSVADIQVVEGNAGTSQAVFTVRMSQATIKPVTVTYETVNGTARYGNDYERITGTLVIPASTATTAPTSGPVRVTVKGDVVSEGDETFLLRLTGVTNATIADGEAQATILDDDAPAEAP